MKQRAKKLMALTLSLAMGMTMLPLPGAMAAPAAGIIVSEEQNVIVNNFGDERSTVINDSWKFYLGKSASAYKPDFNDADWKSVDLPHDFSISQNFTTAGEAESGFLPGGTGWYRKSLVLPKEFAGKSIVLNFDGVYSHATVYVNGTKIGEHHYGYTPFAFDISKYVSCDGASENIIAVEAVNNVPSSRWYSGSGIYRDVKLLVTDPVHVAYHGTQVTTPNLKDSNGSDGTVAAAVNVQNDSASAANVTVRNTIYEKGSQTAVASDEETVGVEANTTVTVNTEAVVNAPKLWDLDTPNLYEMETEIIKDGKVVDTYTTEFGFKWYEFVADIGFKLNGKNVKINGVCMHHDQGALGSAAYYDAMYRQLSKMKEMGVNTIRITHNPGDEDYIDICNEIGLLVIEEMFDGWNKPKNGNGNDFSTHFNEKLTEDNQIIGGSSDMTWAKFVLQATINRDKNDASILMWSLGNEIQEGTGGSNNWGSVTRNLIAWAEEVDTAHLLTSGANNRGTSNDDFNSAVANRLIYANGGVAGFNYGRDDSEIDALRSTYPVILHSETASAVNSRGIYVSQASNSDADGRRHLTSYDTSAVGWGKRAHESIWRVMTRDWVAGECVWTGFDYIGEPTPWNGTGAGPSSSGLGAAPNSSYFGIVETTGFEKDNYYLYRSQWNQKENTLHLVTAWDSDNMIDNGGKTPVWVYSNAPKVELYRDGVLVGTATRRVNTTSAGHEYYTYTTASNNGICQTSSGTGSESLYSVFNVQYAAGTISAKAFDENGVEITDTCAGKTSVSTPGAAAKLEVSQDRTEMLADGSSLAYISVDVTDANGNLDTTAENDITFTLTGNGEIMGVDNGDQASIDKYQQASVLTSKTSAHIKAFSGKALVVVRSTKKAGTISVDVKADGLAGGEAEITTALPDGQTENGIASYRIAGHCYVPVGTAPGNVPLPKTVPVVLADGSQMTGSVTWNAYNVANLGKAGLFTVTGMLRAGTGQAAVSMSVHVYHAIASVKNYATITRQNVVPTLPATVMTYYADGTAFEEFPVKWNMAGVTAASFAKVGSIVEIKGTVTALGANYPVKATVRVAEAILGELENAAGSAVLSQSCDPVSDTLDSITNGIKYADPDNVGQRWTNWNDTNKGKGDPVITMAWDTAHLVSEIRVYYYTDTKVSMPQSVAFKYSVDGATFTEIGYAEPEAIPDVDAAEDNDKAVNGYIYRLNEPINPIAIQIIPKPNGTFVGLTEVEVMETTVSFKENTSAEVDSIKIGGKEIAGFKPDVTEYRVESLDGIEAMSSANAAITVIPNGKNSVKIIAVSEDGKTTKEYTLIRMASNTEKNEAKKQLDEAKKVDSTLYTPDSYARLLQAIRGVEAVLNSNSATAKDYNDAMAALAQAKAGLTLAQVAPVLKKGDTAESGKMRFEVIDPSAKTVMLTKGLNKKATSVKIPATVKVKGIACKVVKVKANAFKGYSKLKAVTIGKNVKAIEKNVFNGCKKLAKVTFSGTAVTTIKSGAFKKTSSKMTVKVPKALKKNKKKAAAFKKKLTKAGMSKKLKMK